MDKLANKNETFKILLIIYKYFEYNAELANIFV